MPSEAKEPTFICKLHVEWLLLPCRKTQTISEMYFQWSFSGSERNAARIATYGQWSVYLMMIIPHKFIVGYTLIALCMISRIYWSVAGAMKQSYHSLKLNLNINILLVSQITSLQGLWAWQWLWWLHSINKLGTCPQEKKKVCTFCHEWRNDFTWTSKDSNSCHRAYSNLCRSFPIAFVGLSGGRWCVKIILAQLPITKLLKHFSQ